MITNKDIRVEHGNLVLNGDKYPLASQAEIDVVKGDIDDLGDTIGDITQTGITGASVAEQLETVGDQIAELTANTLAGIDISAYNSAVNQYTAPTDGYVRFELRNTSQHFYLNVNNTTLLGGEGHQVTDANDYMCVFIRKGMNIYYTGTVQTAIFYSLT
jgi:hypothetical protein